MVATAYDPSPESNSVDWAGITCLGWRTRYGIAAVDPKVIALKSLVYVDGYGLAWAGDIGGDIKGNRIDLCYNTTKEALNWGRRKVRVYVLGNRAWSAIRAKKKAEQGKK
jgi:3D (Asp-Asp-Asp) domain-containing protein